MWLPRKEYGHNVCCIRFCIFSIIIDLSMQALCVQPQHLLQWSRAIVFKLSLIVLARKTFSLIYECTVCDLATAWEGTALDSCSGGEIALTNRDFQEPIQTIVCNGGAIMARGISVEDGCFISRLNVTLNATLQGRSVVCSVDNGTHAFQVGHAILALSTGIQSFMLRIMIACVNMS